MLDGEPLVFMLWFIMFGPQQGKQEAALASYKASGLERSMTSYANETFSPGVRQIVGNSAIIISGAANRYITYTWSF